MHKNFIPSGIALARIMQLIETDITWSNALNRKTIHYGYEYDYGIREPHTRFFKKR